MRPVHPDSAPEHALIARLLDGDSGALGELFDRVGGALYSLALRITRNPALAEDVVEEVLAEMGKGRNARSSGAPAGAAALFGRCRDLALNRRPGVAPRPAPGPPIPAAATAHPVLALAPEARGRVARAALESLPHRRRLVVEHAYFDGWSVERIAAETRIPAREVAIELTSGLVALRERARRRAAEAD
jgi:RNA polymerase sigma-70 factor (ECF subfamily)